MVQLLISNQLLAIMIVLALGAVVGQIPFGPLRFGAAGALFVGLAIGALDPRIGQGLGLVQSLGLALFVYTVGVAAGGSFLRELKRQWSLMVLGALVLVIVAVLAVAGGKLLGLNPALIAGSYAGTLTSTPALAAASAATGGSPDAPVGYALGYPVGVVVAIIAAALVVSRTWPEGKDTPSLAGAGITATTAHVEQPLAVTEVPGWRDQLIRMSYLLRGDTARVIHPDDVLQPGDKVLVVGPPEAVDTAIAGIGRPSGGDLTDDRSNVDFKRFLVSNSAITGRTIAEIDVPGKLAGIITRVKRGDLDMVAADDLVLQPGDRVLAVVPASRMNDARRFFGDSQRRISEVDALSLGIGLALGLLLGLVKIPLPGGVALSLGSAAGPLVVGMIFGALHRSGPFIWDLPQAANLTIRQIGLLMFLATVGLSSGPAFAKAMISVTGLKVGVLAFVLAVAAAAIFLAGGKRLGLSAQRTAGGFAGMIGQPAILAYATGRVTDERIESGYAALFALGIIVKIMVVQVIAVL